MTNSCFGDYGELINLSEDAHKFLATAGISISDFGGSYVCYRPKTRDDYADLELTLHSDNDLELVFSTLCSIDWRPALWYKFTKKPLLLNGFEFEILRIRCLWENHKYETGFTDIAFTLPAGISLEDMLKTYPNLSWINKRVSEQKVIALDIGNNCQVQFWPKTVIKIEDYFS
jgi:hypothetical protein